MLGKDPDGDGIANGIEYVLGMTASSTDYLGSFGEVSATNSFSFERLASSTEDTSQVFQYSEDLINWTDVNLTENVAAQVTVTPSANDMESVTIDLDSFFSSAEKLFWRLKVDHVSTN